MQWASSMTSSPTEAANSGSISSRKRGLLSRSGLISSRSMLSCASRSRIVSHSSRLVLLIVWARSPSRCAAAIWLRMSASSGLTMSVGPAACPVAQQRGGHEVDRRLAPPRALHAQDPGAVDHHVADRLQLPGAELRLRIGGQRAQPLKRRGGQGLGVDSGHLSILAARPAGPAGARRQPPPCLPVTALTGATGGGAIAEIVTTLPSARRRRQRSTNEARLGRRGILRT